MPLSTCPDQLQIKRDPVPESNIIVQVMVLLMTLCLLFGCSNISQYNPGLEIEPITVTKVGTVEIPDFVADRAYTATVMQNPDYNNATISDEDWPAEDWFKFVLVDEKGKKVVDRTFRSSYGFFTVDFIDLDGDETKEVIFILGQGRGTSARSQTLVIYEVRDYNLHKLCSTEYSDYYGPGRQWWYERHYCDTNGDGITELELVLCHDPIGQSHLESPELIPKEKRKVFRWSSSGKGILFFDGYR